MSTVDLDDDVKAWITQGRTDIALWAELGLGIVLHPKQAEVARKVLERDAKYYELHWGNRAGKTTLLAVIHMHAIFYKIGLETHTQKEWDSTDYRTLHAAPLNELALKAWAAIGEITKGVSRAQRDANGKLRPAPLAPFFVCTSERVASGGDHAIMRCMVGGGTTDFRSTEGKGARLEGSAWWLISWDEWPQTENPDDIRYILDNRLTQRAADYDAPIILTGTPTPETEHIAKEWAQNAIDPENPDWWCNTASRRENPSTNIKAVERAMRTMDADDIARTIDGEFGGVKGRVFPDVMLAPLFDRSLPAFQPVSPMRTLDGKPAYMYVHSWDLALAAADNVGLTFRVPADWQFGPENPIVGVRMQVLPGSRTLTPGEIRQTIRETYLGYDGSGEIVLDTTDANGIGIARELRQAGLPIVEFAFNGRSSRGEINKARAIRDAHALLTEGTEPVLDGEGHVVRDESGVAVLRSSKYGSIRVPDGGVWKKLKDQLSVLVPDNDRQRKDAAMSFLMFCWLAAKRRRGRTERQNGRFPIFGVGGY